MLTSEIIDSLKEENILSSLYLKNQESFESDFKESGYVELPNFFTPTLFKKIRKEVLLLKKKFKRREFIMPPYNTPRKLLTLGGSEIANISPFLSALYQNFQIKDFIQKVVGEEVRSCQHPQECIVFNYLKSKESTHGWHLDDPSYALVLIVEMQGSGGLVEFIPQWFEFCQQRNISSLCDVEDNVRLARQENLIYSKKLQSGTAYVIHASRCLHRVSELTTENSFRIALNMAFEGMCDISYGNTADLLYG